MSHVIQPWAVDAFVNIEIGGQKGESDAIRDFIDVLQAKRAAVSCPPKGCHKDVDDWCKPPTCKTVAFVKPRSLWRETTWSQRLRMG